MTETPAISIIVPVYNVEKELPRCVDSLIRQTFENIEIILVDDGSTDASREIVDNCALKDGRIRVIHKQNEGLSAARNTGIDAARADLIGFVDSDDFIHPQMYEALIRNMKEYEVDMSMCGMYDCYEGSKPQEKQKELLLLTPAEAIKIVFEAKKTSVTAVNKLYKKSLFDSVRYPEGKTSEDAFVIVDLIRQCEKIALDTTQLYYYMHRAGSITSETYKPRDLYAIEAYERNHRIIEKEFPQLTDTAHMRLIWAHFYVLDKMMRAEDNASFKETQRRIVSFLKKNYLFAIKDPRFNTSRKIALTLLLIHPLLYRICVLKHKKP